MLALVLVVVVLNRHWSMRQQSVPSPSPSEQVPAGANHGHSVLLVVDFGDGRRQEFEPVPWRVGMTVLDLLREASRQNLRLTIRGTGSATFLTEINGVENEGADGRNWTYTVNGQYADRSLAVYELRPGDHVLWTFAQAR
jgi:hypothetical protein